MSKQKILAGILLILMSVALVETGEKLRVFAGVYQILPVQAVVLSCPDKNGGIRSIMPVGSAEITDSFPQGIALLDASAARDLPREFIRKTIKSRISWPAAKDFRDGVGIDFIGEQAFLFSTEDSLNEKEKYEFDNNRGHYRLEIKPETTYKNGLIVAVQFSAAMKTAESPKPKEILLDKALALDYSRILFISFPEKADVSEEKGIVYWLAILVKKE
jgi:hypothetical protein